MSTAAATEKPTAKRAAKPRATTRKAAKKTDASAVVQRPLWIAVGAVALATEAVQEFMEDALKRGEKLEAKARHELKKRTNGASKAAPKAKAKKAKSKLPTIDPGKIADRVLHALEIPTHGDIESLEKKVNALARKVA